ncbi:uncharacterized protein LOC132603509 [Lycium barbarum]|uniref:uncharacterized protein LOC132603509 n=1 Tax=Lycium barbarum TaxID=112863 RepID=UPI00293F0547|nr:uncharacterized protein LOC132603509 [Lycium barbarum]XP_060172590.1 uncharacterized protein LOC132603509 [Lycium barbarum]
MPGNDVADRVHNFFAQDSLSQEQHHSSVVDGNWPAHSNNLWVGSQRQIGVLTSNTKNYNLQNSDSGKGPSSYPFANQHALNYMQSTPRPEFGKGQSQNQQTNVNGYMYGNQFYQTRPDETKFLATDTGYDLRSLASGGLSPYASHQGMGPEQQTRVPVRSEPSDSPASFDLFGGQQMNRQQCDMQQVQLMLKMQELQRHQIEQLDTRQQNTLNQVPTLSKVASGSHPPALVHDTTNSGALNYPWSSDLGNTNWLQRGSPIIQGCSNGLNPTNIGQAQQLMGLIPLSADQSLYGVPVSGSRGSVNPFSQGITDKPTTQPMPTFDSSFPVNQYAGLQDQASAQDGAFIPTQRSPGDNHFGHVPSQSLTNAINLESPQQANAMQGSSALQDFCGRQGLASPSENSQEKAGAHASSSQNEIGLDPTEERILFGSEDHIWSAFGKSPDMNGEGGNPFDGEGLMNGLSSIQSGTWSALMHSAVAETSSTDLGVQEEWSGLNFHSIEIPSGTQNLMYNSGRHKTSSAEENLLPNSSLNSVSVQPSDGTNMNSNYSNVQGHRLPYEPGQSLHANSSQRFVQSSEEGNKWSNSGPQQKSAAEVNQMMFGSSSHPISREINMRKISSVLTSQLGGAGQLWDKTAGWSDVGSAVPSGDAALRVSSENSSNCSQDDKRKKFIQAEIVHCGVTWNSNSGHNSAVDMVHVGSSIANHQVNSEVFNLQNSASAPNSSTIRGGEETSQLQNNNHSDYWKNTDPFVKSTVNEALGVLQGHVTQDNQVLDRGISDVEARMHEKQNSDNKNSNDSYHSNLLAHSTAANMRENILSDASDSRCLPTGKQKSSVQAGQKNSWPRKFQYHPMGNMDEGFDPSYDRKEPSHSQSMLLQNANHGQSEVFGEVPKSHAELEEGQPYDVIRDGTGFTEVHSQSSFHSGGSSMPGPFNRSDLYPPNKAAQTSPNMLQLLQKVDQSSVRGSMTQLSNSEQKLSSGKPEAENSAGSVGHLQRSQSSASQGFGLQLGPPSQRVSIQNHSLSSQSTQAVRSSYSHAAEEIREKSRGRMHPLHQGQSLPPAEHSLEELKNNSSGVPGSTYNETSLYMMPGKFSSAFDSSSGFPYLRSPLQNSPLVRATGQLSTKQSLNVSFDRHGPFSAEKGDSSRGPGSGQSVQASIPEGAGDDKQDNPSISAGKSQLSNANGPYERLSAGQVSSKEPGSVSQLLSMSGIAQQGASSKMFANTWTNFPPRQPLFVAQSTKESSHIHQSHQLNNMESSLSAAERQGDQDANKGWKFTSELGTSTANILGSVEGEEERVKESPSQPVAFQNIEPVQISDSQDREPSNNLSEGSPANSALMQRDIEAFGRSLKPNNFPHPNYSLLNQVQAMKNVETDPSERPLKRTRVSDSNTGVQQILSADSRILNFSGRENIQRGLSSQQGGNLAPQDVLASHHNDAQSNSHNNNINLLKPEHTQISPQMAPSWFNQYGTFKNAQMLQMYEAHKAASMRSTDQPFTLVKSSNGLQAFDSIQGVFPANTDRSNLGPSSFASSVAIEDFSSPQTLPLNVGQHHQLLKPKKRKRVTSELIPWCKEVSLDSQSNQTISLAETEWAKSTNRLMEKVEEDIDFIEHGPLRLKVKRRLILTTQLIQQLFRPPPSAILFSDANSEYENAAYSFSRLALGDACSMVSCSNAPHTSKEPLHDKSKRPERNDNHMFAKAVEELTVRARRLESDFSRLDKRASILDVIVEGQDIEKFSVFYRFAKFHGRVQSDGVETSSSPDARSHKPLAQRYVTALPMPKNLPSMVQCLSL